MRNIPIIALYLVCACETKTKHTSKLSSTDSLLIEMQARKNVDSIINRIKTNVYWDTVGVGEAPIKVLRVWLSQDEYSSFKDINLRYKNVSGKKIEAIKFSWYGETAFNEPADMGGYGQEGFGGGFTDRPISPGKSTSATWSIISRNAKKNLKAWSTEVAFEDGTKWKSSNK